MKSTTQCESANNSNITAKIWHILFHLAYTKIQWVSFLHPYPVRERVLKYISVIYIYIYIYIYVYTHIFMLIYIAYIYRAANNGR